MKKILSILLLVTLLGMAMIFTSCGDDAHYHTYGAWTVEKVATCTETGIRMKTCSCGDVQSETIPARGHNFVNGVCTVCGASEQ